MIISAKEARALNNIHKECNKVLCEIERLIQEACYNNVYHIKYSIDDGGMRTMVNSKLKELGYDINIEYSTIIKISWEEGL